MKRTVLALIVASALFLPAAAVLAELPPLIPRDVLFGNPDKVSPKISPDGQRLAYIAPDQGVLNVWVRTVGQKDDRVVTKDRKRGIRYYFWAQNNKQVLYVQDKGGDENYHVYAVDLDTLNERDLTPFENVRAQIVAVEQKFPNEILVGLNNRKVELHDVHRVDLTTGQLTLEAENTEGFMAWQADHDLRVRGAMKTNPDGGTTMVIRDNPDSAWRTLTTWGIEDSLTSGPIGFTADNRGLYTISSAGSNTAQLRQMDLATGQEKVLALDRESDVAGVFKHPIKHTIQAVAFNKERLSWKVLDPTVEADFAAIKTIHRGDFDIINRDHQDQTWLVAYETDDGPVYYYAYDRPSKKGTFLFTNRKKLEGLKLARMEPISLKASDGLPLHGYLTKPPGVEPKNLPMVLMVHGGPWYRDSWGYNPTVQWLANRGYAVFQVNFRGSTGYGKHFVNAGDREWGGKAHNDLIDGVKWAIKKGVADPNRIAIFGGSYGGYATLVGLTFTPDVFCCGVDIVGPSNLITFLNTIPP
ncbi:MAG: S9 family peptidase, partial [Planctomycetota bacterium]